MSLIEGDYPSDSFHVLAEYNRGPRKEVKVGMSLPIILKVGGLDLSFDAIISGIVESPLYATTYREPSVLNQNESVIYVLYFSSEFGIGYIPTIQLAKNEASIKIEDQVSFDNSYFKRVSSYKEKMLSDLKEENMVILTNKENAGTGSFKEVSDNMNVLAYIIGLFFVLVSSLITGVSFKRLIMDERPIIACSVSLGFPYNKIRLKYILLSTIVVVAGCAIGLGLCIFVIPPICFDTFATTYVIPNKVYGGSLFIGGIVMIITVLWSLLSALFTINKYLKETPASLLMAEAPIAGKKILLERIPFIWKHLNFRVKSSFRNVFRYLKNTSVMVLAIAGSIALVFLGFGLVDNCLTAQNDPVYGDIIKPLTAVAVAITLSGCALCALIMFNLLGMNIEDRRRELATLKVLGYLDKECLAYTFREMFMITIMGALIGLPVGVVGIIFVFDSTGFGKLENVHWYIYILSVAIILVMNLVVTFVLYPKIKKIEMSESFKSIE